MTPDFISKWEHILEDVEKQRIPVYFLKKVVIKLEGKRQQTINVERFLKQGLDPEEVEEVISRKLHELDPLITSFEFVLNVECIAETVQPETDRLLSKL